MSPLVLRRGAALATATIAVLATGACSKSSVRDDRPRVTSGISGFAARLMTGHQIAATPAAVVGPCTPAGWASVSWSAPVTQHTTDPLELENDVIGVAELGGLRLDVRYLLAPASPREPAAVFATKDHRTALTLTVTGQRTVRVDGYASCPAGKG